VSVDILETKNRLDGPPSRTQEKAAWPTLCGPECSCDKPIKTAKWKIVIMLVIMVATTIAILFKEMM
jgi:hypothetical protein